MKENTSNKNYKHLDKVDRDFIEVSIAKNEPLKRIAKALNRGTTTITNEILHNRSKVSSTAIINNDCVYAGECTRFNICGDMNCPFPCKWCRKIKELGPCTTRCKDFHSNECSLLLRPPYVCNSCHHKDKCIKTKFFYHAKEADNHSSNRNRRAHRGPKVSDIQLANIDRLLRRLLKQKGQSLEHILETHKEEIGVSLSTLYIYIKKSYLDTRLIDLRRAPAMVPRAKKCIDTDRRKDRSYKTGRTYNDYYDYVLENTDEMVCEMDTVIGKKSESKRILTILIKRYSILLIFLLPDGKAASVCNVFNYLNHKLGLKVFRQIFPVILTDNGTEFQQVEGIECSPENDIRTYVYYCDPNRSDQKGSIERAHELIRYVLPKGTSFQNLEQNDFTLLMNHINSYYRKSIGGKCPYDLVLKDDDNMHMLMELLHMKKIPPDEVNLTPSLLKKKTNKGESNV